MKKFYPMLAVTLMTMTAAAAPVGDNTAASARENAPASLRKAPAKVAPEDWKFKVSADDIISDQPAGTKKMCSKSGNYYSLSMFGISEGSSKGMPCTVVEGTDGFFYIYDPFAALDSKSWLKAKIDGDKMTVDLPQAIYTDGADGETYVYVAQMCHFEETDPVGHSGVYVTEEGDTQIVFNREGESWVMQTETRDDHPVIMGLVAADDGTWCGYSDWNTAISPFEGETVTPPADLKTEQWSLIIPLEGHYVGGKYVNVGFTDKDVYMRGFSDMFPEAWIKGTLADGKVTFPSRQYLGADEMSNTFGYFFGGEEKEVYNEEWDFTYMETSLIDQLTFDYDATRQLLSTKDVLIVNKGQDELYMQENISAPRIHPQGEVTDFTPADPVVGSYSEPGDYAGSLYFDFPTLNNQEQILDPAKLYYVVYVDDEPLTFYTDEYAGLSEDTEEIPFLFTNMNNLGFYGTGNITHFMQFTFTGYESMAIQTLYRDGDREFLSGIVNVVGESSVATSEAATVKATDWFDLAGRRVSAPQQGIYIKRVTYTDGSVKAFKTVK